MPAADELIAYNRNVEEIQQEIGADWLVYQDLEDLLDAGRIGNPEIKDYEASVFSGHYVTGDVDEEYLNDLEKERRDEAKDCV